MTVRPSAVAGLFYPADPVVLRDDVVRLLATASVGGERSPKGLIAPHAGYEYSGPVAASKERARSRRVSESSPMRLR